MNLTFTAPQGQDPYRIDAGALNNELAAAFGGWCNGWSASHNASQAIVDIYPADVTDEALADAVGRCAIATTVILSHIANTAKREHNKGISAQIVALEASITPRMLRASAVSDAVGVQKLQAIDVQIAALRATLQ